MQVSVPGHNISPDGHCEFDPPELGAVDPPGLGAVDPPWLGEVDVPIVVAGPEPNIPPMPLHEVDADGRITLII